MSHDKIRAATRKRMAETGEPYAVARREVTIPVVSDEHRAGGLAGPVARVALAQLPPGTGDIAVSGPPAMVAGAAALAAAAVPSARLHADTLPGAPRPL
jgi:hypothetical protein